MRQVTARYRINGLCTEAEGLRHNSCLGAEASFDLVLVTDTATLLTGSGHAKATLTLVRFVAPDGENETGKIKPADRVYGPVDCPLVAGRINIAAVFRCIRYTVTAYLMPEGAEIAYGHFEGDVTCWYRCLTLRRVAGNFGGKLLIQEFSTGANGQDA